MAKGQSLAAQTGALSEKFSLPAIFQAPQEKLKDRYIAPYITFAHPNKADEWAKLTNKLGQDQVAEGDMFLMRQDGVRKLPVAKLGWIIGRQYWALSTPAGLMQEASFVEHPYPFRECIEAVVLVYLEDEVLPANVRFKTTKCPGAKILSDTLAEASSEDWAGKSQAHRETLIISHPWGRFYGNLTVGPRVTAKSSGMPYRATQCSIQPTGVPEWRLLKAYSESENCQKMLEDAAARYEGQLSEVSGKAK